MGFPNLGNSCYMNSALQCLMNCKDLKNYFLEGNYKLLLAREDWSRDVGLQLATKGVFTK